MVDESLGKIANIEAWASLSTKDAEKVVVLDDSPPLQIVTRSFAIPFTNPLSLVYKIPLRSMKWSKFLLIIGG